MYIKCLVILCFVSLTHQRTGLKQRDIIVTNNPLCTDFGKKLSEQGATAIEIFIGAAVCEGIVHPQDTGLGGGFMGVIYNAKCEKAYYFNAREKSPRKWNPNKNFLKTLVLTPSALKGYQDLYNIKNFCDYRHKLDWKTIFNLAADIAMGWKASASDRDFYSSMKEDLGDKFSPISIDSRRGIVVLSNLMLWQFLEGIAEEGSTYSSLYEANGNFLNFALQDAKEHDMQFKEIDLVNYKTIKKEPVTCLIRQYKVYSTRFPGSGRLICFALDLFDKCLLDLSKSELNSETIQFSLYLQVISRVYSLRPHAFQYHTTNEGSNSMPNIYSAIPAVAKEVLEIIRNPTKRWLTETVTQFGHLHFRKRVFYNLYGTSHIVVRKGDITVTMTSSINYAFGSRIASPTMGFFYNNQGSDFTFNETFNKPLPNSEPLSSMSGTIVVDTETKQTIAVGAAGGQKIITAVLTTLYHKLFRNLTDNEAITIGRCTVMQDVVCEETPEIQNLINKYGLDYSYVSEFGYSAATVISPTSGSFDHRRGGSVGYLS